ncbi:MAG: Peptidase family, partial [Phycisphaerales bacterium]|nr:Peptidase family [Phycisphaerales bacterium]
MGWEDRPYYRDPRPGAGSGPLNWLMTGSVPLFTVFGIRVRAHASLVVLVGLVLLLGIGGFGDTVAARVQLVLALFLLILLHEFGHCFAARWTGGHAEDILMTPLGGLAMAAARPKPWPTFFTVAGGPAVNVILCLLCGAGLFALGGGWPLTPSQFVQSYIRIAYGGGLVDVAGYLFWFYTISYYTLLFNLLPIFPMDGGQLLQSILWKPLGYYKSMMIALTAGLFGGVLLMMVGLATLGAVGGGTLMMCIGLMCVMNSYQFRTAMRAEGPWAFSDRDEPDRAAWFGSGDFAGGGYASGGYGGGPGVARAARKAPRQPSWLA